MGSKNNWRDLPIPLGPSRNAPEKKAVKYDKEKPMMDLFPPKAFKAISQGMTHGAKKYNRFNYKLGKGLNWTQPYAACMRHLNAWNDGEDMDKDSGLPHLWLAGCELVMLLDLVESKIGDDTRFG